MDFFLAKKRKYCSYDSSKSLREATLHWKFILIITTNKLCFLSELKISWKAVFTLRGRSQNLKEILQNFTEIFNIGDVTANDIIQRNQYCKEKKINLSFIVITDIKLASSLRKDSEFCFSFLWQEHYHSKIPGAWLCVYVSIAVLFWQKVHGAL